VLAQLLRELAAPVTEPAVALRGRDRFTRTWQPAPLARDAAKPARLRQGGVYLVTGGLGGIGLSLAEGLARETRGTLVLLGRSGLPSRDAWDAWVAEHGADDATSRRIGAVRAIEAAGGTVMLATADVADAAQVAAVVARARAAYGAVHGIVHAAGTLDDGLLAMKTRAGAAAVLAPKVQGTMALDAAIGDAPLDFFVCCSSVSAVAALPGQSDYAAANAFLDAFCEARTRRTGEAAIAIGWSAWRDVGMAAALARGDADKPTPTGHPALAARLAEQGGETLFSAPLATDTHWVLDEHRVKDGTSLLPGTGYLELVRAAVTARPDTRPVELRDVAFLAPFVVENGVRRELRVALRRGGDGAFAIAGRLPDGGWEEHVTGQAGYVDADAPAPLAIATVEGRCTAKVVDYAPDWEHPQLAFGPRWKNIRRVAYGAREALMRLELPVAFHGDLAAWPMHPAVLDMATAGAVGLIPGADPRHDFYVPMSYGRVRIFAPLPAAVVSHVRLRESEFDPREVVAFDITIADASGRVCFEATEFLMARVKDGAQLGGSSRRAGTRRDDGRFEPPAPRGSQAPAGYDEALTPAEGVEAFLRLVEGAPAPHVLITPRDAAAQLAAMRAAAAAPVAAMPTTAKPTLPLHEIEAVLAAHPAVRQAVALARADRAGSVRLVAYYVEDPEHRATVSELRRYLKTRMPDSLVPGTFVALDALPLTADGAVDRGNLPDPFGAADDYVAPRTDMERAVADTWREVLGVEKVGAHDNFFDIGGHSLLAVRVITRLDKRLGVKINNAMMVLQTLEQIAAECERQKPSAGASASVGTAAGAPAGAPASAPSPEPDKAGLAGKLFKAFGRKG
jgi:NAD(P)-dependent dehydrogenase (short-subunit alcohol dehydrogenase family)/acyl carrier protein